MNRAILSSAAAALAYCVAIGAQAPLFAGTWRLDAARSRVTPAAGLAGLIPNGAPETLHITQPANGTLVIESQINEGHSRMYRPGGKTSTPAGQGGSITMASKWDGRTLVSEGTQDAPTGASIRVREVMTLNADGKSLTIDVTTTGGAESSASTLVYTRTQDVGPCQSWPTPCKPPSPARPPGAGFGAQDPSPSRTPPTSAAAIPRGERAFAMSDGVLRQGRQWAH